MRRRMAVALLVSLGLFAGAGAGAQTTTTSSSTTSTTSSSTTSSTAVVPTTSTTVGNPCTGQPCTAEPPGAVLSTPSTEIAADRGSYCWLDPVTGLTSCLALALPLGYKPPVLVVTQGEVVTVSFTAPLAMTPTEVALVRGGDRVVLPAANPTSFLADLSPGMYEQVGLSTRWLQGEVPYVFRLDVRAPAQPATPVQRGGLTLTG